MPVLIFYWSSGASFLVWFACWHVSSVALCRMFESVLSSWFSLSLCLLLNSNLLTFTAVFPFVLNGNGEIPHVKK